MLLLLVDDPRGVAKEGTCSQKGGTSKEGRGDGGGEERTRGQEERQVELRRRQPVPSHPVVASCVECVLPACCRRVFVSCLYRPGECD